MTTQSFSLSYTDLKSASMKAKVFKFPVSDHNYALNVPHINNNCQFVQNNFRVTEFSLTAHRGGWWGVYICIDIRYEIITEKYWSRFSFYFHFEKSIYYPDKDNSVISCVESWSGYHVIYMTCIIIFICMKKFLEFIQFCFTK